ncbi:MAG: hypothetical protein ACM3SY_19595 [Candidatus Omnitrophota bacterium]
MQLRNDSFQVIPGSERLASVATVFLVTPFDESNNKRLIGTREDGFFIVGGQTIQSFPTDMDKFETVNREIRTIVEEPGGDLWLGARASGVFHVEFQSSDSIKDCQVTRFGKSSQLPDTDVQVFWAAGHAMFGTTSGLLRFDPTKKIFVPDDTLGREFSGKLSYVYRLEEDTQRSIWLHAGGKNFRALDSIVLPLVGTNIKFF